MSDLFAVHVHLEGFTAFFKHPLTITGTQISLPCPPYSTILGLISACAGRVISPQDTRVGFEFRCASTNIELERTNRLVMDDNENLKQHTEGQGILKRYIHYKPRLDLYVTNPDLDDAFKNPASTPYLGRSQDLVWITDVEQIKLTPAPSGNIGPTMIPSVRENIPALIIRCPEWFSNNKKGTTRLVGPMGFYQAILPTTEARFSVKNISNLYHPSNFNNASDVVYIHQWHEQ
jgi:CRISPR-associated protein Cas5t